MSLVLVMLDGVGLAPAAPTNPLVSATMPVVHALLGGPLTLEQCQESAGLLLRPLDTTFGIAGLPQSGTGHTALLTGLPAPRLVGRHQPAFPPRALHAALTEQSVFAQALAAGHAVALANAYSPGYWQALAERRTRRVASTIAAEGAGLSLRTMADLVAGRALLWDITGALLRRWDAGAPPPRSPQEAGAVLGLLAREYALVYYECFLPDLAAHGRVGTSVEEALALADGLIGGLLGAVRPHDTLVVVSDHGNCEDSAARGHTRNPVPLLVVGPAAPRFAAVADLAGVAAAVLAALG